jgi:hypothetical protein
MWCVEYFWIFLGIPNSIRGASGPLPRVLLHALGAPAPVMSEVEIVIGNDSFQLLTTMLRDLPVSLSLFLFVVSKSRSRFQKSS